MKATQASTAAPGSTMGVLSIPSGWLALLHGERGTPSTMRRKASLLSKSLPAPLTFSASSSNAAVATATVSGQTLTVEALALGSATITAMADDGNGGTASTSFTANVPTAVAVEDGDTGLPTTFALEPNYPNPFNPETRIRFGLPQSSEVRLTVFDVLGREVAVLVEGRLPAGWHEATFEAKDLPSGVYLYKLHLGSTVLTRRLLLLK